MDTENETLPPADAEIDWRAELERLVKVFGEGHLMSTQETAPGQRWPQIVPGSYAAWERAWILLNRAAQG